MSDRRTLRSGSDLAASGLISPEAAAAADQVAARYPIALTPHVASLIDPADPADPIGRQYLPDPAERTTAPHETADPIGDEAHLVLPGVIHRYPTRVLLRPLLACPVYCRFCFRREAVGPSGGLLSDAETDAAIDYVARHTELREAILSGGDPLMLSPRRLVRWMQGLSAIPHLTSIRIHTRVPVADPERLTPALLAALDTQTALFVAVHVNHPRELAGAGGEAIRGLVRAGIPVVSQSVLLAGVNDDPAVLEALFLGLLRLRALPYALHLLDPAPGTARFAVSLDRARGLLDGLRGRIPGLAHPTLILDLPGGHGKIPAGSSWIEEGVARDPRGRHHWVPPHLADPPPRG